MHELSQHELEIRRALADYMQSEGCSCCRDDEAHKKHKQHLAYLLEVPPYEDNSGWNFDKFATHPIVE